MKLVNFQADPIDHLRWKEAARIERISLGSWIRRELNRALGVAPSQAKVRRSHVQPKKVMDPNQLMTAMIQIPMVKVDAPQIKSVTTKKGCTSRVPKGSFCKRCERVHK